MSAPGREKRHSFTHFRVGPESKGERGGVGDDERRGGGTFLRLRTVAVAAAAAASRV